MAYTNLHFLPLFIAILFPLTFIGTYIVAVLLGHVESGLDSLPLVSDAAAFAPQSCFFGQFLNFAATLMALCVYIRHRQLLSQRSPHRPSPGLLRAGLWAGWASALGVSMVANFQLTNLPVIHLLGAFLAFGVGIPYFWIQVVCTSLDPPERFSRSLVRLRATISSVASALFVLHLLGSGVAFVQRGGPRTDDNRDLGRDWFLLATASEWFGVFCLSVMIATFAREFHHVSLDQPQVLERTKTMDIKTTKQSVKTEDNNNEVIITSE